MSSTPEGWKLTDDGMVRGKQIVTVHDERGNTIESCITLQEAYDRYQLTLDEEPAEPVDEEPEEPPALGADAWADHADYPVADWQHEVGNGDTRLGYIAWRKAKLMAEYNDDPLKWRTFEIPEHFWEDAGDSDNVDGEPDSDRISAAFYLKVDGAFVLPMHIEGYAVAKDEDEQQVARGGWDAEFEHIRAIAGDSDGDDFHTIIVRNRAYVVCAFPFYD